MRVSVANGIAQVLPLAALPITTRLYSASDFGVVAVLLALITLLGSVATFRLDWLVSVIEGRIKAVAVLIASLAFALVVSCFIAGVIASGLYAWVPGVDWRGLGKLVWLIPVGVLGSASFSLLSAWFVRQADLAPIAKSKVRQGVLSTALVVAWGVISPGAVGLAVSSLVNTAAGSINLFRAVRRELAGWGRRLRPKYAFAILARSRRRVGYSGVSGVVNTIGLYLPNLILGFYFLPYQLGWFSVMLRIGVAPTSSISSAVFQSFWGELSVAIKSRDSDLHSLFVKTSSYLIKGALLILMFCLCGPLFVDAVLGAEWEGAGWLLVILAPMVASQFVASTLAPIVTALGAVRWLFAWDCFRTTLLIASLYGASAMGADLLVVIGAYSFVMTGMYAVLFVKASRLAAAYSTGEAKCHAFG